MPQSAFSVIWSSARRDKEVQESCTAGGGGGSGSGTGRSSERERERASTLKLSNSPTFSFTYTCQLSQKAKRRGEALVRWTSWYM